MGRYNVVFRIYYATCVYCWTGREGQLWRFKDRSCLGSDLVSSVLFGGQWMGKHDIRV
jgi:hypothetical protein